MTHTTDTSERSTVNRRTYLGAIGAVGVTGLAGCTGSIPFVGDETMEFSATVASIPPATLDDTGYEEQEIDEVVNEETVEAAGQRQDVLVTTWQAEYDKSVDVTEFGLPVDDEIQGAVFTVLSTPQVSVLSRTFNPVGDMDSEELAEMVQDRFDGIDELERVGEDTVSIREESTAVGEFETAAELRDDGHAIDVTLHIAEAVESGDDLIVGVGGYPTAMRRDERDRVMALFRSIEH